MASDLDDTDQMKWSEVAYRPTGRGSLEQLHTEYQHVLHRNALARLDKELKQYVKTMPRRELPTYTGGVLSTASDAQGTAATPPPPPDPDMADRIYSRSAVQRYVLQRLATELHAPFEQRREEIPFHVFRDVLQAPNASDLPKLNPQVVPRSVVAAGSTNTTPSPNFGRSGSSPHLNASLRSDVALPPSMQLQASSPSNDVHKPQAAATALVDEAAAQNLPPRARLVFDTASFPNMTRGVRVTAFKAD